jgi:thymidylate kinase
MKIIAIEGCNGAGKSYSLRTLQTLLELNGFRV